MVLQEAKAIAEKIREDLLPHCYRCEIAGSVRRKKHEVKDIEIVIIPKPYETGLFTSGIAAIIGQWQKVKGELGPECRYTQRIHPGGIKIDIFFARPENWGLIFAIRTGSSEYSRVELACRWVARGYHSRNGMLESGNSHEVIELREEEDLFKLLGITFIKPENREVGFENGYTTGSRSDLKWLTDKDYHGK